MGTLCGEVCRCRSNWELPGRAGRALLASAVGHLPPAVARSAAALGLTVYTAPSLVDVIDPRAGTVRLKREVKKAATMDLQLESRTTKRVAKRPAGES